MSENRNGKKVIYDMGPDFDHASMTDFEGSGVDKRDATFRENPVPEKVSRWILLALGGLSVFVGLGVTETKAQAAESQSGPDVIKDLFDQLSQQSLGSWDNFMSTHHIQLGSNAETVLPPNNESFAQVIGENMSLVESALKNTVEVAEAFLRRDLEVDLSGHSYYLDSEEFSKLQEDGWLVITSGDLRNLSNETQLLVADSLDESLLEVAVVALGPGQDDIADQLAKLNKQDIKALFEQRSNDIQSANIEDFTALLERVEALGQVDPLLITISEDSTYEEFHSALDKLGVDEKTQNRVWQAVESKQSGLITSGSILTGNLQRAEHDFALITSVPGTLSSQFEGQQAILLVPKGDGVADLLRILQNDDNFSSQDLDKIELSQITLHNLSETANDFYDVDFVWNVTQEGSWQEAVAAFGSDFKEMPINANPDSIFSEAVSLVGEKNGQEQECVWLPRPDKKGGLILDVTNLKGSFLSFSDRSYNSELRQWESNPLDIEEWNNTPPDVKIQMLLLSRFVQRIDMDLSLRSNEGDWAINEVVERAQGFKMSGLQIVGVSNLEDTDEASFRIAARQAGLEGGDLIMSHSIEDESDNYYAANFGINIRPDGTIGIAVGLNNQFIPVNSGDKINRVVVFQVNNLKEAQQLTDLLEKSTNGYPGEVRPQNHGWIEAMNAAVSKEGGLTTHDMWGRLPIEPYDLRRMQVHDYIFNQIADKYGLKVIGDGLVEVHVPHPQSSNSHQEVVSRARIVTRVINPHEVDFVIIPESSPNFDKVNDPDFDVAESSWFGSSGEQRFENMPAFSYDQKSTQFVIPPENLGNEAEFERIIGRVAEEIGVDRDAITLSVETRAVYVNQGNGYENSQSYIGGKQLVINDRGQAWLVQIGSSSAWNGNLYNEVNAYENRPMIVSLTPVLDEMTVLVDQFLDESSFVNQQDEDGYLLHPDLKDAMGNALFRERNGVVDSHGEYFYGENYNSEWSLPSWMLANDIFDYRHLVAENGFNFLWDINDNSGWNKFEKFMDQTGRVSIVDTSDGGTQLSQLTSFSRESIKGSFGESNELVLLVTDSEGYQDSQLVKLSMVDGKLFLSQVGVDVDKVDINEVENTQLWVNHLQEIENSITLNVEGEIGERVVASTSDFDWESDDWQTVHRMAEIVLVEVNGEEQKVAVNRANLEALTSAMGMSLEEIIELHKEHKEKDMRLAMYADESRIYNDNLLIRRGEVTAPGFIPGSKISLKNGDLMSDGIMLGEDTGFKNLSGKFVFNEDKSAIMIFDQNWDGWWLLSTSDELYSESLDEASLQEMLVALRGGMDRVGEDVCFIEK